MKTLRDKATPRNCPLVSAPSSPELPQDLSWHDPPVSFQNSSHHVQVSQSHQDLWLIQEVSNEEMMCEKVPRERKGCIQCQVALSRTFHSVYYLMVSLNGHWTRLMSVPSVLGHDFQEVLVAFRVPLDRVTHHFPLTPSCRSQGTESPEHVITQWSKPSLSFLSLLYFFYSRHFLGRLMEN